MKSIIINCPETVLTSLGMDKSALTIDLAMVAAVKYFQSGRLSAEPAAELAGVSRLDFLERLKDHRVSVLGDDFDELIEDYHHA